MGYLNKARFAVVMAIAICLVVIGVLNLRDRLRAKSIPDDGIEWVDTSDGIQARAVSPDSPLAGSVRAGDYFKAYFFEGKFEIPEAAEDIARYLDRIGINGDARYSVHHPDPTLQRILGLQDGLYDINFKVIPAPRLIETGLYLAFVGVVYLAIGLFVLFKQNRAALTYHFFAWFMVSFVVYFYEATTEFTTLDKLVYCIDGSALALLAPLFLHFCAEFPSPKRALLKSRAKVAAVYVPAVLLIALEILSNYGLRTVLSLAGGANRLSTAATLRTWLDRAELFHYAGFFLLGSLILVHTFYKAKAPLLRQQLKWIVWGLGGSILPFLVFNGLPELAGFQITPLMTAAAIGPLILMPLSFGYSIVRYRLMDVDVIMRRSFVHVLAMGATAAMYMALLLAVGDLVKFIWETADLNTMKTRVVVVLGMLAVTVLFSPIKNKLQKWADQWFYGERYTFRMGLQDFGRALAQTTALPHLLTSLVRRLSEMLSVTRIAIFIEDESHPSDYRLAHSLGLEQEILLPADIKQRIRTRSLGRGFLIQGDLEALRSDSNAISTADQPVRGLHYYVPCVVRDRMVAIIGLGRAESGALLSSEDTELVRALAGYVAVAIENSLLYRSEMEKAEELARLKEFSENVIESVAVGIVVVDRSGTITTWNSSMEELFGLTRDRALGRDINEIFDADLIETIRDATGQSGWELGLSRHIYKYNATLENGRPLTINISIAPFQSAPGVVSGTLMVIENVTDRAQLEQQLLQREKLSSIGLLAAGVAHEVNTPLAGISSYSQMLLQQIPDNDPKHHLLQKINAQTLRASGIVNNLLNFSRTADTRLQEVDLNKVLDDTLQLLETQLRNSGIEIDKMFSRALPAGYGNMARLQQVFMNLVLNARDAMPGGGRLTIRTHTLETSLVVEFADTGIGIRPEHIARIYDPFFTTKEVGQGTGLGLALSYGIIQEHGGRIFVESRPGEGTCFTVKLPTASSRHLQAASD